MERKCNANESTTSIQATCFEMAMENASEKLLIPSNFDNIHTLLTLHSHIFYINYTNC